jgi:hypothetical protein
MTEEPLFIQCEACQAQVRLQMSAENLEIRFCPKCGAAVKPVRTENAAPDGSEKARASGVRPLAPQLLPGAATEPTPFRAMRATPPSPKMLSTGAPLVQVKPPEGAAPKPPPPINPAQHVREAPIAFVPAPPVDDDPPLPAILVEDPEEDLPVFDLSTEHVKPAPAPPPPAPLSAKPAPAIPLSASVPPPAPREPIKIRDDEPPPKAVRPLDPAVEREVAREARKKARRTEKTLLNRPLWEGVYNFPFRIENLRVLILLVISLSFMGLLGCAMHALVAMMFDKAGPADMTGFSAIMDRAALYVFLCLVVLGVFVSLHQAAIFLRVIEETSAGVDEFAWPKDPWFDYLGKWLFLAWVCAASTGLWAILVLPVTHALPIPRAIGWVLVLLLGWCTFPIVLFSTMAASAFWMLLHPLVIWRMVQKPIAMAFLFVNAGLFLFPTAILAYGVIGEYHFSLLIFAGPIWALSLLCYARVLGRVGFELMREDGRKLRIQT